MVNQLRPSVVLVLLAVLCAVPLATAQGVKTDAIPEGLNGFRGILVGKIVSTDAEKEQLVLKVEEVKKSFEKSTADNPKQAVGKSLLLRLPKESRLRENFRALKTGDMAEVGAFQVEKALTIVELLRKVE